MTKKTKGASVTNYAYDVWGNMVSAGDATYTYRADGIRISKTHQYLNNQFTVVGGNVWKDFFGTYTRGIELISNGRQIYLYNIRGDVIQLLKFDGSIYTTYDYDAYGNEYERDNNDGNYFRYCGEYYDTETGFIYLRARYYDPMVGRFTSVDPVKDGLNWYAYCENDPVNYIDPFGRSKIRERTRYVTKGDYVREGRTVITVENGSKGGNGWYSNVDEAAYSFGLEYNGLSVANNLEYSATIYSNVVYEYEGAKYTLMQIVGLHISGEIISLKDFFRSTTKTRMYTYDTVVTGDYDSVHPLYDTTLGVIEAVVHTHAGYTGMNGEEFSAEDKDYADSISKYGVIFKYEDVDEAIPTFRAYLWTPNGDFRRYDTRDKTDKEIGWMFTNYGIR